MSGKSKPENPKETKQSVSPGRMAIKTSLGIVIIADILLGVVLLYLVFIRIPYFRLQHIEINSDGQLSRQEIIEASEVAPDANMLLMDLEKISDNLKRHPRIASASVYRRFPGKLLMEISERRPVAIVSADRLFYVDGQGEVFTRVLPGDRITYPLFTGVTQKDLKENRDRVKYMIRKGVNLLKLMERPGFPNTLRKPAEIRIDLDHGLSLFTSDAKRIILGVDDYPNKLKRLTKLRKFLGAQGKWPNAKIIDLDYEDRALIRHGWTSHPRNVALRGRS